jgi:hypothetical protein
MKVLNAENLNKIAGGLSQDVKNGKNTIQYSDDCALYGTVVVPPSANGQTAHLTLQVLENNFINKLLT